MNIPQIYLVEPYNAYAPKGRKKHWMEEVEEQALLARIIAEQQARQQAELDAIIQEAKSRTLPPQAPPESVPTIVGNTAGAGSEGGAGSAPGGGGMPVWDFWNPAGDTVNFDRTPSTGAGPVTVTFTNLTTTPQFDSYNWYFSDGQSSTAVNPIIVFQTGSTNPTVVTASLQTTNSISGNPGGRSPDVYIIVSYPVVTAGFTFTTSSNIAPFSVSFVNTSTNTSQTPTTTYRWTFTYNDGVSAPVVTTSTAATPPARRIDSGSFTASLQATGSYGIASAVTHMYAAPAPTFTFALSMDSQQYPTAPTFANINMTNIVYNGNAVNGTYYGGGGKYYSGDFSGADVEQTATWAGPSATFTYRTRSVGGDDGKFTASLALTESSPYRITYFATTSFYIPKPTISVTFTVASSSNSSPALVTLTPTVTYDGHGTQAGQWGFGEWAEGGGEYTLPTITTVTDRLYDTRSGAATTDGKFTASLQITESSYSGSTFYTQSFALLFPTLEVTLAVASSSNYSPSVVTLTPTITNNGAGTVSGKYFYGEFTEADAEHWSPYAAGPDVRTYDTRSGVDSTGSFTASLQLTGSNYGVTAFVTQSIPLLFPSIVASFTTTSFGFGGVENSYMEPVTMSYTSAVVYNGNGTPTYLWDFGSASFFNEGLGTQTGTETTVGPHTRADYGVGGFTASLQATGSYDVASLYTQSFTVST